MSLLLSISLNLFILSQIFSLDFYQLYDIQELLVSRVTCLVVLFQITTLDSISCYGYSDTYNFYFIFSDFTFLFLYLIFLERRWRRHVTRKSHDRSHWCDITSLEHGGIVWKMTSGHMEYTWWPWVRSEADMRMEHGL